MSVCWYDRICSGDKWRAKMNENIMVHLLRVVKSVCLHCGYFLWFSCVFMHFLIIRSDSLSEKPCIQVITVGLDIPCNK